VAILFAFAFLFLGIQTASAANDPVTALFSDTTTTVGMTLHWTNGALAGDEATYTILQSTDGATYPTTVSSSIATTTDSFAVTDLATNTLYWFQVIATGGTGDPATTTLVAGFTLATPPGTPTVTSTGATTLNVTIDAATNPTTASTTFLVYDSVQDVAIQADGTWGASSTGWLTYSQLGAGSATTTTGVATNTAHTIKVLARNGQGINTAYSSSASSYTLAATPNTPVAVTSTAATTLTITLGADNAATTYLVYDSAQDVALQVGGTWGASSTAWLTYAQLGGGSATTTTGLATNTAHTIKVLGRNADGVSTAAYSAALNSYTLTSVPTTLAITVNDNNHLTATWSSPATTDYAENTTAGTNSGWVSTASFSSTGLSCATAYTFRAKGRNGDGVETDWASSVSGTTAACGGGGSGGGGSPSPSVTPIVVVPTPVVVTPVPVVTPAVPATTPAEVVAPSVVVTTPVVPVISYNFTKNLVVGSVGTEVRELQKALKDSGHFTYPTITGYFGNVTKNALIAYQQANGLTTSGQLDSATRAVLNSGFVASTPAPTASVSYNFTKNLGVGSVGNEVRELQKALKDSGHFVYPTITNYFGNVTKNALIAYQKANGLTASGKLDSATRSALGSGSAPVSTPAPATVAPASVTTGYVFSTNLYPGNNSAAVKALQQKLKDLGYFTVTPNGNFGPATKAAVVKFQKDRDLKPFPGFVGPGTRSALNAL